MSGTDGVRPALVLMSTAPLFTPDGMPVASARTVNVVLAPGGTAPVAGTVHSQL